MSYLVASPEALAATATHLAGIGSTISQANGAAAAPTTGVIAAASDEVSAAIASLFSSHAQEYQALSTQVAAFHAQFVQTLNGAGGAYAAAEAANASPLQNLAASPKWYDPDPERELVNLVDGIVSDVDHFYDDEEFVLGGLPVVFLRAFIIDTGIY